MPFLSMDIYPVKLNELATEDNATHEFVVLSNAQGMENADVFPQITVPAFAVV